MRAILLALAILVVLAFASMATADEGQVQQATYQGKTAQWWGKRAVQARKDANARAVTIKRLRGTLGHDPSIEECIRLATVAYPSFTELGGRSSDTNPRTTEREEPRSTASGLYRLQPRHSPLPPMGERGCRSESVRAVSPLAGCTRRGGAVNGR
jgi:hypothetical protein